MANRTIYRLKMRHSSYKMRTTFLRAQNKNKTNSHIFQIFKQSSMFSKYSCCFNASCTINNWNRLKLIREIRLALFACRFLWNIKHANDITLPLLIFQRDSFSYKIETAKIWAKKIVSFGLKAWPSFSLYMRFHWNKHKQYRFIAQT